jgi:NAD-dependent oxidoreductase involved in siderophore biosynthesis
VHDTSELEARGIPTVYVASAEFAQAGAAQAQALGFQPAVVLVEHPIQDRTDEEMRALAERAVDEVVCRLTQG